MRLQFRLRTLLIAMAIVSVGLAWFVFGEIFHSHKILSFRKSIGSTKYWATVCVSEHLVLPRKVRLYTAILETYPPLDEYVLAAPMPDEITPLAGRTWYRSGGLLVLTQHAQHPYTYMKYDV